MSNLKSDSVKTYLSGVIEASSDNHRFITQLYTLSNMVVVRTITALMHGWVDISDLVEHFDGVVNILTSDNLTVYLDDAETGGGAEAVQVMLDKFNLDTGNVKSQYFTGMIGEAVTAEELRKRLLFWSDTYTGHICVFTGTPSVSARSQLVITALKNSEVKAAINLANSDPNALVRFPKIHATFTASLQMLYMTQIRGVLSLFSRDSFLNDVITGKLRTNEPEFLDSAIQDYSKRVAVIVANTSTLQDDAEKMVAETLLADWNVQWQALMNLENLTMFREQFSRFQAMYYYRFAFQNIQIGTTASAIILEIKGEIQSLIDYIKKMEAVYVVLTKWIRELATRGGYEIL